VQRGLIRVDADELTYPLHIMLRYELEKELLTGQLAVRDLAEAWNAGMEQRLGIRPSNDIEGCLQDIHWAVGSFGYFPSYALGAAIAAQLYESLRATANSRVCSGGCGRTYTASAPRCRCRSC
jgi:carboxypeptidase Taq